MAFDKKTWANNQAGGTPLDASGLNDLESRIADSIDELDQSVADKAPTVHTHSEITDLETKLGAINQTWSGFTAWGTQLTATATLADGVHLLVIAAMSVANNTSNYGAYILAKNGTNFNVTALKTSNGATISLSSNRVRVTMNASMTVRTRLYALTGQY